MEKHDLAPWSGSAAGVWSWVQSALARVHFDWLDCPLLQVFSIVPELAHLMADSWGSRARSRPAISLALDLSYVKVSMGRRRTKQTTHQVSVEAHDRSTALRASWASVPA